MAACRQQNIMNIDYLLTPDGTGGTMKKHYKPEAAPVVVADSVPLQVYDDYSTGVHPGFTFPVTESKKQENLYEKERQIELTFAMREDSGVEDTNKSKPSLVFHDPSPVKQLDHEFDTEVRTKFVTPKLTSVNDFSPEEWNDMAALID